MPPSSVPDSAGRAARDLRVVFGRLYRRLKEVSSTDDLTPAQASLLSRLGKDGEASPGALAAAERVRPQAVGPTLTALRQRGLVEQRSDPTDGRRQVVSLSPAGRALFDDANRAGDQWLTHRFAERFTEAERQALLEALSLLDRLA